MMTFPIYGKIKHVPNHQPIVVLVTWESKLCEQCCSMILELTGVDTHTFATQDVRYEGFSEQVQKTPRDFRPALAQSVAPHHHHHVQKLEEIDASTPDGPRITADMATPGPEQHRLKGLEQPVIGSSQFNVLKTLELKYPKVK